MAKGTRRRATRAAKSRKPARKASSPVRRKVAAKRPSIPRAAKHRANGSIFSGLKPNAANFAALTPISFLARTAAIHPDRLAVVHGELRLTYNHLRERVARLASALARHVRAGETVAAMLPNVPAMLEVHFGVPILGAVLNTINTRLDAATLAYILAHGEAKVLITDREYAAQVGPALARLKQPPLVIDVDDPLYTGPGERLARSSTRISSPAGTRTSKDRRSPTKAARSRSTTPRARPATRRASSITTAARSSRRSATPWRGRCRRSRCTCGRCRCSTATAGASRGRLPPWAARMCACAGWIRR